MNITVVTGHLTRPPERRVLPSGDELVGFDVRVAHEGGRAESVPVVWPAAPAAAHALVEGEEVLVVGRVRRRFFRSGGATQSRTEVVADSVVAARRAAARKAVERASAELRSGAAALPAPRGPRARGAGPADQVTDAS